MKQFDVDVSPPASIINLTSGRVHKMAFACKLYIWLYTLPTQFWSSNRWIDGLDPCNLWRRPNRPLTFTHKTFDLDTHDLEGIQIVSYPKYIFLNWWPWPLTLTFKVSTADIPMHFHTKFCNPGYKTYRDMNFYPVNFGQVTDRHRA